MQNGTTHSAADLEKLALQIKAKARALGFAAAAVADVELGLAEERLLEWLARGFHGDMDYMARHGTRRARPAELVPGTVRSISVRMDYLPEPTDDWVEVSWARLADPLAANVSRYAHGRDYHKVLKGRLEQLARFIEAAIGPIGYRVFTDSAPVLEVELARRSGLGWRGKHTLLIARAAGSMFFLGEIFVDVPLPVDAPTDEHCGRCTRCIDVCPTRAIVAPYVLDARRCISYLTIELEGSIPVELRPLIGNRVYGCDDCQLVCPWNKYAQAASVGDFAARGLETLGLMDAFAWDEATFLERTAGSAMRRIGHARWQRNVAVALGNALAAGLDAPTDRAVRALLAARLAAAPALVAEHVHWALGRSGPGDGGQPERERDGREHRAGRDQEGDQRTVAPHAHGEDVG